MKKVASVLCSVGILLSSAGTTFPLSASATTLYGDVNSDGLVNSSDMVDLLKYLTGMTSTNSIDLKNADVDKNTVIDSNDYKILTKNIMGTIVSLPYSESGITFNYNSYTLPSDEARSYKKYDCSSGVPTNYSLSIPSTLNSASDPLRSGNIDDRILDSSADAQCIVYLSYKKSDGKKYRGTGFIIDDHTIATCAHCLFDGTAFNTDYTIKVYNTAGTSVIATYSADELHIPANYYDNPSDNYDYDYGLIYVDDDLSQYGKMTLSLPTNQFKNTAQDVCVSGFPSNVNGSATSSRYYAVGSILTTSNNYLLNSSAYVSKGDSGGPMYLEYSLSGDTFRSAVGICEYYAENPITGVRYSGGVRITQPLLRFFLNNSNIGY